MNSPIENVAAQLRRQFPAATVVVHAPVKNGRVWSMDLTLGPTQAEVEWSPSRGFGVSVNSEAVFGAQSDEAFASADAVVSRLVELIQSGKQTEESAEHFIRALREGRKLTQTELAKLLRVKQASISRLESRADFHVSTLSNIIARLGGSLELRATFPDGSVHIVKFAEQRGARPSKPTSGAAKKVRGAVRPQSSAIGGRSTASTARGQTRRKSARLRA